MSKNKNNNDEEKFGPDAVASPEGEDCEGEEASFPSCPPPNFWDGFDESMFYDIYENSWPEIDDAADAANVEYSYLPPISSYYTPRGAYQHEGLDVGDLVDIGTNHGIVLEKIDVMVSDDQLTSLADKGITLTASSINNTISNWDFRPGLDNSFYVVAVTTGNKTKKVMIIGWRLKQKV